MAVHFKTDDTSLDTAFDAALSRLRTNLHQLDHDERLVLIEGAEYNGVWLECAPLEGLVYACVAPQIAYNNHRIFFQRQREDGYLPCWLWPGRVGTGQIQMVVPIAATSLEVFEQFGDYAFLEEAYDACARWDRWLATYRDTRRTGLCEAFCEFDTGHDQSPRFHGLPQECPNSDARICPPIDYLPYLAPDLSATVYGGRLALARMAAYLGRTDESQIWRERAETIRRALVTYCYDPEDGCFYDLDSRNRFVRIRGDALTRVFGEGPVDQHLFEHIYHRQITNPNAFWTPYPLPSIAADDPVFVRDIPANSWGGAAQALTALRAPRWFERYGKYADLNHLMRQWIKALSRAHAQGIGWRQQMNPWSGEFTPAGQGYSPSMLVMLDFVSRLYGVQRVNERLIWGCHLPPDACNAQFVLDDERGHFQITRESNTATLSVNHKPVLTVSGDCRILTDLRGSVHQIIGTTANRVKLLAGQSQLGEWQMAPDQIVEGPTKRSSQ